MCESNESRYRPRMDDWINPPQASCIVCMTSSCTRRPSKQVCVTIINQLGFEPPFSPHLRENGSTVLYLHPVPGIQLPGNNANPTPAHRQLYVSTSLSNSQFGAKITPDRPWSLGSAALSTVCVTVVCPLPFYNSHVLLLCLRSNTTLSARLLGHLLQHTTAAGFPTHAFFASSSICSDLLHVLQRLNPIVCLVVYIRAVYKSRPVVNQIQRQLCVKGTCPPRTIIEVQRLNDDNTCEVEVTF